MRKIYIRIKSLCSHICWRHSLHTVVSGSLWNRIILFIAKVKIAQKRSFNNLSNEYKFSYVPRWVCSEKKGFLMSTGVLIFFLRKNALKWVKHAEKTSWPHTWLITHNNNNNTLFTLACPLRLRRVVVKCLNRMSRPPTYTCRVWVIKILSNFERFSLDFSLSCTKYKHKITS